jgi:putative oxidoreductase
MGSFDLTDPLVLLRVVCGLFFIPHIAGKLLPPQPAYGFFTAARMPAPRATMYLDAAVETLVCLGLVLGIYTVWAAWLGALVLLLAAAAVWRLQTILDKPKWLWNIGGIEYPLFWCLVCVAVALAHGTRAG